MHRVTLVGFGIVPLGRMAHTHHALGEVAPIGLPDPRLAHHDGLTSKPAPSPTHSTGKRRREGVSDQRPDGARRPAARYAACDQKVT